MSQDGAENDERGHRSPVMSANMNRNDLLDPLKGRRRINVDFSQLRHVVAAADHGSFRQAADALSIRQSTLSRSVQLLEHSFGIAIFERSSGGVRTTPAGRHFLRRARSILEQIDSLATTTRADGSGESGRLSRVPDKI
jgi:hypothetical protein